MSTNLRTEILFIKIMRYAKNSEDPDMFDYLELEYHDLQTRIQNFRNKIEKLFEELNLKI